jgi:hypothetical protein
VWLLRFLVLGSLLMWRFLVKEGALVWLAGCGIHQKMETSAAYAATRDHPGACSG